MRFKVLVGQHTENVSKLNADGDPVLDKDGNPVLEPRTFKKGEVVDSASDLSLLNSLPNGVKFLALDEPKHKKYATASSKGRKDELVEASKNVKPPVTAPGGQVSTGFQQTDFGTPETPPGPKVATPLHPHPVKEEDLDAMSVKDLHDYATEHKVDLKGATLKADVVKAIRTHRVTHGTAKPK